MTASAWILHGIFLKVLNDTNLVFFVCDLDGPSHSLKKVEGDSLDSKEMLIANMFSKKNLMYTMVNISL